jgi:hypothetical protein
VHQSHDRRPDIRRQRVSARDQVAQAEIRNNDLRDRGTRVGFPQRYFYDDAGLGVFDDGNLLGLGM